MCILRPGQRHRLPPATAFAKPLAYRSADSFRRRHCRGTALSLQCLRQHRFGGSIIVGVAIGPNGFAPLTDQVLTEALGTIGVTLLLFPIGMGVSPRQLARAWRIALDGTLPQIAGGAALACRAGLAGSCLG
jgi:Kef-type K+ transport system membrane component KefB